jgi:two-component system, NtrC family, sensor kinase
LIIGKVVVTNNAADDPQQIIVDLRRRLDESIAQQVASSEVLRIISASPGALTPVFEAIVKSAVDLCEARFGAVFRMEGDLLHLVTDYNFGSTQRQLLGAMYPMAPNRGHISGRAVLTGSAVHIADIYTDEDYKSVEAKKAGFRSLLAVPLLQSGRAIGSIVIYRTEPGPFTARQSALLQTFADQAVIAIENARLFNETKSALERQTATADILKIIASSPDDVQPVFDAIVERSNRLAGGLSTAVYTIIDDMQHLMSFTPISPEADAALQAQFPVPLSAVIWGEKIRNGQVFRLVDTEIEFASQPSMREMTRKRGFRSLVFVPLVRDKMAIGLISVTRVEPGSFADQHVELLQTFVDQAVIAISNVKLFQDLQQRTLELSASLDDLRAAQDRLVQTEKLASLGQLTAGIAHEIKNPLNFVNNFSLLSAELIDELDETLAPAPLDQKMRGDVGELTQMLKSNLEKVVQHGKRADSIVKNMLLHSRDGSGEHRSADINALVEESLNLAYHGARAEKSGFQITLKHDLDPDAGAVELYPQEITRALLNLISNGFYAASKRKSEAEEGFEPTLSASTKNLGKTVEICIRDNGTGIPPEVKEKMFNPFFTTKPAGEGTGLGLSMSHDIIVKQHGGTIDVATEPGVFTEFIITLPRNGQITSGRKPG